MNNKDITINLVTKADNSGAEEAKQAIDEVNTSAQNTGQVTQAASKTSIKSIREIGSCVQWLGSRWAKVGATMAATFGVIGLISQAANLLKIAWEWFNKDAIEAEKKKQELIAETTKYLAKQAEETKKEREAKGNAKASELILDPIKKEIELLQKRNTEIQTGIELRFREIEHMASLANDDIQIERIKLARQKEAGEITESQWLKKDQDLRGKAEDNNDKKERAVHQTKIDAKGTEKDGIEKSLRNLFALKDRLEEEARGLLAPLKPLSFESHYFKPLSSDFIFNILRLFFH